MFIRLFCFLCFLIWAWGNEGENGTRLDSFKQLSSHKTLRLYVIPFSHGNALASRPLHSLHFNYFINIT